jgi:hypothetical protein
MMFLTRGATYPGLPPEFAYPAAFGDLITAIIAFAAIPLVLRGSRLAKPIVWVFNVFGTVDLLLAITTGTIYNAVIAMGPTYWIPAFWVPLLLVTHYVTFVVLRRGDRSENCNEDTTGLQPSKIALVPNAPSRIAAVQP